MPGNEPGTAKFCCPEVDTFKRLARRDRQRVIERGFSPAKITRVDYLPFGRSFALKVGENPRSIVCGRKVLSSLHVDGAVRVLASLQLFEHSGAAGEHVAVGGIEVAGVPGIGHIAGAIGPIEQA